MKWKSEQGKGRQGKGMERQREKIHGDSLRYALTLANAATQMERINIGQGSHITYRDGAGGWGGGIGKKKYQEGRQKDPMQKKSVHTSKSRLPIIQATKLTLNK